jgi:hypothetical protein
MRATIFSIAFVLSMAGAAVAQEWDQFVNTQDGFKIDFPGSPKVSEGTWKSEYGYSLPMHVYTVDKGKEHYSMTVVDYTTIEQMGLERQKQCPAGAEPCLGGRPGSPIGPGYSRQDIRGAMVYTTYKFIERDATVTHLLWNWEDLVEGNEIHLTNHADQSRTMAFIAMHHNHLYVLEGTVPKGYPEPGLFFQSLGWVDKDGNGIRYQSIYVNELYGTGELPEPGHGRGGQAGAPGQGQGQGQGGAPAPAPAR